MMKINQNNATIIDLIQQMAEYEKLGDFAYAASLENQILELQEENEKLRG